MTLRELRAKTKGTGNVDLPTAKALLLSEEKIVFEVKIMDTVIKAYENGFAVYSCGRASTVIRVDDKADYTYFFSAGETKLHEQDLLDEDCSVFLTLFGEDRLVHNRNASEEQRVCSYSDEEKEWGALEDTTQNVEKQLMRKELIHEIYSCLTPYQEKIMKLYYEDNYNVNEIAEMIGTTHQMVSKTIRKVRERIRKKFENI